MLISLGLSSGGEIAAIHPSLLVGVISFAMVSNMRVLKPSGLVCILALELKAWLSVFLAAHACVVDAACVCARRAFDTRVELLVFVIAAGALAD